MSRSMRSLSRAKLNLVMTPGNPSGAAAVLALVVDVLMSYVDSSIQVSTKHAGLDTDLDDL